MKNLIMKIIQTISSFVKAHAIVCIVCAVVLAIAISTPIALHFFNDNTSEPPVVIDTNEPVKEETKEDIKLPEQQETEPGSESEPESDPEPEPAPVPEPEKETTANTTTNKPTSEQTDTPSNNTPSKKPTDNTNNNSEKKEETQKPQENNTQQKTVVRTEEGYTNSGLKYVDTIYSDGTVTSVVECRYCHKMPCQNGGGENCAQYNVQQDAAQTCQQCGRPLGDGHNGTCYSEIDWENGGKTTCHNYD